MDRIFIGSDHAAFEAKENLKEYLSPRYEVLDVGTREAITSNYPDFAIALVKEIRKNNSRGILLCGSGVGVSMVANRFKGIRAALVRTPEEAKLSRQHNNANVLCLGGRISSEEKIKKIVDVWLETSFEGGRHQKRLDMFENLGEEV